MVNVAMDLTMPMVLHAGPTLRVSHSRPKTRNDNMPHRQSKTETRAAVALDPLVIPEKMLCCVCGHAITESVCFSSEDSTHRWHILPSP
jgi:hypothetical protein